MALVMTRYDNDFVYNLNLGGNAVEKNYTPSKGEENRSGLLANSVKENTIIDDRAILLPNKLRGRSIDANVIPTVCNLKNMLKKLLEVNGDGAQLKQWEKKSYQAYQIEKIKSKIMESSLSDQIKLIRNHILNGHPADFGASCIDIYLVAFVAENYGVGREVFFDYIKTNGISEKVNSAQAIWQVGKGDGIFLNILNEDGSVKDWDFIEKWVKGGVI